MALSEKHCAPCEGGVDPMEEAAIADHLQAVPGWEVRADTSLFSKWTFSNFKKAIDFVNQVGEIAEAEGHHPDIAFGWGYVEITLTTHAINGLSENDFILAAKINQLTNEHF